MTQNIFEIHERGALEITPRIHVRTKEDLAAAYTPGIAQLCGAIAENTENARRCTLSGNLVAVITDGSAVLGLGNIGPKAGLPVVEGKALLARELAGVNAIPLCIGQDTPQRQAEIIAALSGSFAAIHLEDFKAPECFELEERLQQLCSIPVYHDDQHGTAIAVLAGLINAAKLRKQNWKTLRTVILGAGASGIATARLLKEAGAENLILVDQAGILDPEVQQLNAAQTEIAGQTNPEQRRGSLSAALQQADVLIGLSAGRLVTEEMVRSMAPQPILFALANPQPEIDPQLAHQAGAGIVATGSSQYPNQINNVLVYPGLFKGLLESGKRKVTTAMKLAAAEALAHLAEPLSADHIIPDALDQSVAEAVSRAVAGAQESGAKADQKG